MKSSIVLFHTPGVWCFLLLLLVTVAPAIAADNAQTMANVQNTAKMMDDLKASLLKQEIPLTPGAYNDDQMKLIFNFDKLDENEKLLLKTTHTSKDWLTNIKQLKDIVVPATPADFPMEELTIRILTDDEALELGLQFPESLIKFSAGHSSGVLLLEHSKYCLYRVDSNLQAFRYGICVRMYTRFTRNKGGLNLEWLVTQLQSKFNVNASIDFGRSNIHFQVIGLGVNAVTMNEPLILNQSDPMLDQYINYFNSTRKNIWNTWSTDHESKFFPQIIAIQPDNLSRDELDAYLKLTKNSTDDNPHTTTPGKSSEE